MKTKRVYYLDVLRIIATLAVIIIHVSSQNLFYTEDVRTTTWQSLNFWDGVTRWCVPIFVMISGVLFLNPNRKIDISKLFKKNIKRIIYVALFWHLIYGFYNFYDTRNFSEAIATTIQGYSHLWFLHMIIGLYLIVPFLRKITDNKNLTIYFLILSTIFTIILPTFLNFYNDLSEYRNMSILMKSVGDSLTALYTSFYFHYTLGFVSYFVAGYYFDSIEVSKNTRYAIYTLGILGMVATFLFTGVLSYRYSAIITPFYSYTSINVALTTLAIFIAVKKMISKVDFSLEKNIKKRNIITGLSSCTMGIYLVHFLIVHVFTKYINGFTIISNILIAVPVISICTFVISLLITKLIKLVPILKKFMM